jgi:signal transduction histidine kinase
MSTTSQSFCKLQRDPDVLGDLLHSLSQPLTSLRCSLELSIEEVAESRHESVAQALLQTEKVIGMIQLMREYLDAEQPASDIYSAALAPALRNLTEELSSIAAVRGVQLCLVGSCSATVPVPRSRLRLALQYLITAIIEAQPARGKVLLLLGEDTKGAVLRAEGDRGPNENTLRDPAAPVSTLRRVRLAIASRVLETAGASLAFGAGDAGPTGFVLRVPHHAVPLA